MRNFKFIIPLLATLLAACGGADTGSGSGSSGATRTTSGTGAGSTGGTGTATSGSSTSPVNLRSAGNFVILAETQISSVPTSAITGDIAISPSTASAITGLPLTADASTTFATTPQVTGKVYAANDGAPTPSTLTTAIGDMNTAFTDAAGRAAGVTELGAGNISGLTLTPGVYKWSSGLLLNGDLHLSGGPNDVWIFEIAQGLTVGSGSQVVLAGGALAKNVFWQVAGLVDLGTTSHVEGILLSQTAITLRTGASVHGRLLAQSAVSIDSSSVVQPAP